ncbi:D-alanyl-D-alanine carboxypeptidase [Nonlabens sp. Hel1_33_55]|uniref:serine hydrolase domain-containing protein n=1 Tax=Nonlabens sp. Hel1_33_55 TaxID=1336802 RepID=UPI000875BEBF|nr:serine hydrolase [Nonlabens sp. Hel1_33_55]SCY00116.1 D-alanyl-D-alanine carboxypeptidase [Nonlabens sp. Hel1_33_55]
MTYSKKNKLKNIICALLLFIISINSINAQNIEKRFETIIDSIYNLNRDGIGFIVHIEAPDRENSWSYAVGHKAKNSTEALDKNQPVLTASNTKTYVSAAILKLIEKGDFTLDDSIEKLITKKAKKALKFNGYGVDQITVRNLLSHTSGITDYVDDSYFNFVDNNPDYNWTKSKQIKLAMKKTNDSTQLGKHSYGDINYLLLADIIEKASNKSFYTAIRENLNLEENGLDATWFQGLEKLPKGILDFPTQYTDMFSNNSTNINPSWDLFGGGGLASTAKDLAVFFQLLYNGNIIKDKSLLSEMTTQVDKSNNYCLGVFNIPSFFGTNVFYHGGFWGTDVVYIPELNTSIAIFTLVKEKRNVNISMNIELIKALKK